MKNPKLLRQILLEVRKKISVPLTLKFRSGWDFHSINAVEIAKLAEDSGVDAITIHPRAASQLFTGKANWDIIRHVKQSVKIPVIGNGDIFIPDDAVTMINVTGCNGVMVGRGAFGNPWIFKNILTLLSKEGPIKKPLAEERGKVLLRHLDHCVQLMGDKQAFLRMRKQYPWYVKNMQGASMFRNAVFQKNSIRDVKEEIEKFFLN